MNALTQEFTAAVEAQFSKLNKDVADALKQAGLAQQIGMELEQKAARWGTGGGSGSFEAKSWGEQFVESDGLRAFAEEQSRPGRFRMDVKTTITTGSTSGGPTGGQAYRDGINAMPQRRMRVRDLLPVVGISTGSVEYPKQTLRTNAAAPVAEAASKPESAYGFTMQTVTPKVIAHWVPASRQILDDAPQLRGIIDSELLYGLALKEEEQLLSGDDTGENLNGLITNATTYAAPTTIDDLNLIDVIALAMLQNALAEEPADGIVLHPSDWLRMRTLKNAEGDYILGAPGAAVAPMLFGLPVVATQAMTANKFLVGGFMRAGTIYDRWTPRVEVSTEHSDFFTKNLVAILAEERLALAIKNAVALTYGDFDAALAA
jgi:HK97 family phage major capsid protein